MADFIIKLPDITPFISFSLPGPGEGKDRHRSRIARDRQGELYIHNYNTDKTNSYEDMVRLYAKHAIQRAGGWTVNGQFWLAVTTYKRQPKGRPKAWKALADEGAIRDGTRPDWDNIGKVVSDALNEIAYKDDARVVFASLEKRYARDDEAERVEVRIYDITDPRDRWSRKP